MITFRTTLAIAAASALTVAATACGGHSAAPASAPASTDGSQSAVPVFHADHNARKAVTVRSCLAHPAGSWTMAGSVSNQSGSTGKYTLVVDFVTVPGNTVVDTSVVHLNDVAPGASAHWQAEGGRANQRLACVLRYAQAD